MSDLTKCNIDTSGAFGGCLPNINIRTADESIHQLENLSQDTHQHIVSYLTSDRDMVVDESGAVKQGKDAGFVYDRESFEGQLNNSGPTTLMIREIDLSMNTANVDVTPDGPPRDGVKNEANLEF